MKKRGEVSEAEAKGEKKEEKKKRERKEKRNEPDFPIRQLPFRVVDPATAFRLVSFPFASAFHPSHVLSLSLSVFCCCCLTDTWKSRPAPNVCARNSSISAAVMMYLAWSDGISCLVMVVVVAGGGGGVWALGAAVARGAMFLRRWGGGSVCVWCVLFWSVLAPGVGGRKERKAVRQTDRFDGACG